MMQVGQRFHTPGPLSAPRTVQEAEAPYTFAPADARNTPLWSQVADARGRALLMELASDLEQTHWRVPSKHISQWYKSQQAQTGSLLTGVSKAHMYRRFLQTPKGGLLSRPKD